MKKFFSLWRSLFLVALVALVLLGQPDSALARRGGGRIGGGSFRTPTRSVPNYGSRPSYGGGSYRVAPSYGYGGYGGNFFFLPFLVGGGGGGSLIGLLALVAIAGVALQAFRGIEGGLNSTDTDNITLTKVQVGLLSSGRSLQQDLSRLALEADTGSSTGLALLLGETTVSLLRHPEYWVYADGVQQTTNLESAEQKFNALAMTERSKLNVEVLSNVNNRLLQGGERLRALNSSGDLSQEDPSEYIVVTLIAAVAGNSLGKMAAVRSAEELRLTLSALGSVPEEQLLALEILWEPQSESYTLTSDEVLSVYPNLIRI